MQGDITSSATVMTGSAEKFKDALCYRVSSRRAHLIDLKALQFLLFNKVSLAVSRKINTSQY